MKQSFTRNQLVRLLYNETTPEETSMLIELTELCEPLKDEFEELKEGFAALGQDLLAPSQRSIDNVIKYSTLEMA